MCAPRIPIVVPPAFLRKRLRRQASVGSFWPCRWPRSPPASPSSRTSPRTKIRSWPSSASRGAAESASWAASSRWRELHGRCSPRASSRRSDRPTPRRPRQPSRSIRSHPQTPPRVPPRPLATAPMRAWPSRAPSLWRMIAPARRVLSLITVEPATRLGARASRLSQLSHRLQPRWRHSQDQSCNLSWNLLGMVRARRIRWRATASTAAARCGPTIASAAPAAPRSRDHSLSVSVG